MPSAGGLIISTDARNRETPSTRAVGDRNKKWAATATAGAPAGRTRRPTASASCLLRDDDRKRRAQDRQKRALQERDEFLSMQIAQAEFLEAAAAPPVRRRFQDPPPTKAVPRLLPQIETVQGPEYLGGRPDYIKRIDGRRTRAARPVDRFGLPNPEYMEGFIRGARGRGGSIEAVGIPGAGSEVAGALWRWCSGDAGSALSHQLDRRAGQ